MGKHLRARPGATPISDACTRTQFDTWVGLQTGPAAIPQSWSRRRAIAAYLVAPLVWCLPSRAVAKVGNFQIFYDRDHVRVVGQHGGWALHRGCFGSAAQLSVSVEGERMRCVLYNAELPGTDVRLDADISLAADGAFSMHFVELQCAGTVDFDRWCGGDSLLVLATRKRIEFVAGRANVRFRGSDDGLRLTPDWTFEGEAAEIFLTPWRTSVGARRISFRTPLSSATRPGDAVLIHAAGIDVDGPSSFILNRLARMTAGLSSGEMRITVPTRNDSEHSIDLALNAGDIRIECIGGGVDDSSHFATHFDKGLLSYREGQGMGAESEFHAFLGEQGGEIMADGVATLFAPDPAYPVLRLTTSGQVLSGLQARGVSVSDYAACDGVSCDLGGRQARPLLLALAGTNAAEHGHGRYFQVAPNSARIDRSGHAFELRFKRREDKLDVAIEFYNVRLRRNYGGVLSPRLMRIDSTRPAYALYVFPPQHVSEKSEVVDTTTDPLKRIPIASKNLAPWASERTRLAFRIPDAQFPMRFSMDNLLRFDNFEPVLGPTSSDNFQTSPADAVPWLSTVINFFKMSLVPVRFAVSDGKNTALPRIRWWLPAEPPAPGRANEVFHARMIDQDLRNNPLVSSGVGMAVAHVEDYQWNASEVRCEQPSGFIRPVSQRDRSQLRVLTFLRRYAPNLTLPATDKPVRPLLGSAVVVGAQGGYFRLEGNWDVVPALRISLVRYLHQVVQGRDVDVTIVREYFMYPFGHRVLLVKQTLRRNRIATRAADKKETYAAPLETEFFLLIKDDEMSYGDQVQPLPWRQVRVPREYWRSPPLDFNRQGLCSADEFCPLKPIRRSKLAGQDWKHQAFWPTVGHELFEYEFEGVDYAGKLTRFKRAVILIENADNDASCAPAGSGLRGLTPPWQEIATHLQERFEDSRDAFNGGAGDDAGIAFFNKVNIAVASSRQEGDTDLAVTCMSFTAKYKALAAMRVASMTDSEHPCPYVPTVHWVEGQFPVRAMPNARYDGGMDGTIRTLVCDPESGVIYHPELTGDAWVLDLAKPTDDFKLQTRAVENVSVTHIDTIRQRSIFAIIDRRPGAGSAVVTTSYAENTERSGGIVSPDIVIGAASREFGATALPRLQANNALMLSAKEMGAATDFFPVDAKLCGVELVKIIAPLFANGVPPAFTSVLTEIDDADNSSSADLDWQLDAGKGEITAFPNGSDTRAFFYPGLYTDKTASNVPKDCTLVLRASLNASVLGITPPELNISAALSSFTVHIGWGSGSSFNGVGIPIKSVSFLSKNGQKPSFGVDLGNIFFVGHALEFIDQLQENLKKLGQGESGWRIGFENNGVVVDAPPLMFPDMQLGAFSVENLGIYSGLFIPFFNGGGITFRFSLAKPDSRFRVTAGIWAGGGYALLELDTDHVRRFELCIEFGAAKSLRYGPIKGDVGILGGLIYQSIYREPLKTGDLPATPQTEVTIEAFVRAFGTFSAWNLISLFMELYVGLKGGSGSEVTGTARFSMSTKVGFVSYSYTASHREVMKKSGSRRATLTAAAHPATVVTERPQGAAAPVAQIHTDVPFIAESALLEYFEAYME